VRAKIEKVFMVKLKILSINHHFLLHQTRKNTENIFQKIFYAQINEALFTIIGIIGRFFGLGLQHWGRWLG
jgi:hypothetical protein